MSAVFPGPSGAFEAHIKRSLSAIGVEDTPTWLLAGVIMNVMVLMTENAHLKLSPITIWMILSLRNEISMLCAVYKVNDVEFHFDSPLDAPYQLIVDFFALNMSSAMLSKNPMYWRSETQILLKFLALVRTLMRSYGSEPTAEIIAHYSKPARHPPSRYIRHTGVGPRVANALPGPDGATPSIVLRTSNKSNVRFSPFARRSRPSVVQPARPTRLDLNDESCLELLSDAPLRMRRRRAFGFSLF